MRDAVFTLCPAGDTPESNRIYQAVQRGSIPLVDTSFQGPPIATWSELSRTIHFSTLSDQPNDASGKRLRLPPPAETRSLQWAVWARSRFFDCEPENRRFSSYLVRSLQAFSRDVVPKESEWRAYAKGGAPPPLWR